LFVFAKPNAKKSKVTDVTENNLHIALQAKPQSGEANIELKLYLAKLFQVPKSQVIVMKGLTSRYKQVSMPFTNSVSFLLNAPEKLKS
tara:strand:+ start:50169 stop:50432 length:264 start_codon:yes stop_codon:yes gene_type:complete